MLECQAAKPDVAHELARKRLAFKAHELSHDRRDENRGLNVFSCHGQIGQDAGSPVEVPLSGGVQRLGGILDVVAGVRLGRAAVGRTGQGDRAG